MSLPTSDASVSGSGKEAFEQARQVITSLPGDPLLGDWLTDDAGTGDLSTCRRVKLGPDEIAPDGTNLGPSLRLVYRLLPSNTDARQAECSASVRVVTSSRTPWPLHASKKTDRARGSSNRPELSGW